MDGGVGESGPGKVVKNLDLDAMVRVRRTRKMDDC